MPWYEITVDGERLALIKAEDKNAANRLAFQLNDSVEQDAKVARVADDIEDCGSP